MSTRSWECWLRLVFAVHVVVSGCSALVDTDPSRLGEDERVDGGDGSDAGDERCDAPGVREVVPCGRCGSVERFCTGDRRWAYGDCSGEGVCTPGEVRADGACGLCGTTTETCTLACAWSAPECVDEGECAPGTRSRSSDGCADGQTREVVCNAACELEPAGECGTDACDRPGVVETVSCGMCGTRERFCTADRTWVYGTCGGEGICAPGTTRATACGRCGERTERCDATCTWDTSARCVDEGECTPGESSRTREGCPAGQSRPLTCDGSCDFVAGSCEVDECVPGTTSTVACGRCGTRTRTCSAARAWVDGPCTGEGVCSPGETSSRACGRCGTEALSCNTSCRWSVGECRGEGPCRPGTTSACVTACGSRGTQTCTAACTAGTCVPPDETCNGSDDDCDGSTDEGCPTCEPMSEVCPSGWTYSNDGTTHRCAITFTPPPGVMPYCLYADMGYLGFLWRTPPTPPEYTCPAGARYALAPPVTGYCVWDPLTIPSDATIECPVATGRMEFRWPCD